MSCPACGGDHASPLGLLGSMEYVRCRACGFDYVVVDADPDDYPGGEDQRELDDAAQPD